MGRVYREYAARLMQVHQNRQSHLSTLARRESEVAKVHFGVETSGLGRHVSTRLRD